MQLFCVTLLLVALCATSAAQVQFYVDCVTGDDAANGTLAHPFKTPTRARDAIRALKRSTLSVTPVTVNFREGDCLSSPPSSPLLSLMPEDSGTEDAPIVYKSYEGEHARFLGGVRLSGDMFSPWSGHEGIYQADLSGFNFTTEYGSLNTGQLGACANSHVMELFFNASAQTRARWPNIDDTGKWHWTNIVAVTSPSAFQYSDQRQSRWGSEKHGWVHGYWGFGWADNFLKIKSAADGVIQTEGQVLYQFKPKARYYGVNLLCELDAPGEYYIDVDTHTLYFYPPRGAGAPSTWQDIDIVLSTAAAVITNEPALSSANYEERTRALHQIGAVNDRMSAEPSPRVWTHLTASNASLSYVQFLNLGVHYAQGGGLIMSNVDSVVVFGGDYRAHGGHSVVVAGYNNLVSSVSSSDTGCTATSVTGGDETTLTRGNNVVQNCTVRFFARVTRTYNPGIGWGGVGNTYTQNSVGNAPHTGMIGGGNNNVFSKNLISNLCYEVTDSGAWYSGRSWARRGNLIVDNTFENIYNTEKTYLGYPSVQAIYFDDELSGDHVINNTFSNCQMGVFVGGGRSHVVQGNRFRNCTHAIHMDTRGLSWQKTYCAPGGNFQKELVALNYQNPPYSTQYPALPRIFDPEERPCWPVFNQWLDNEYCSDTTHKFADFNIDEAIKDWNTTFSGNTDTGPC